MIRISLFRWRNYGPIFDLMQAALEELHPSLYWFTSAESLRAAFVLTMAAITRPLTEQGFIHLRYSLFCQIWCEYTRLEPSQAYRSSPVRPKLAPLPFDVIVRIHQAWIIANNSTDSTLRVGDELLFINDVPVGGVIRTGLSIWNGSLAAFGTRSDSDCSPEEN